jgi:hypothetical protein
VILAWHNELINELRIVVESFQLNGARQKLSEAICSQTKATCGATEFYSGLVPFILTYARIDLIFIGNIFFWASTLS